MNPAATVVDRRSAILGILTSGVLAGSMVEPVLARAIAQETAATAPGTITADQIAKACWVADIELTLPQCEEIAATINRKLPAMKRLHESPPTEDVPMPLAFVPSFFIPNVEEKKQHDAPKYAPVSELPPYAKIDDVLNWSIAQLATGLRKNLYSSVELTQFYFQRLEKMNPTLLCVVRMNDQALEIAKQRDQELREGKDRGMLHGIPWGAKDIIAVAGMPTTWGVGRYQEREWNETATVALRMEQAGAVLLAKLSVGTMAWGDEWYGGKTKNPWDVTQGSSGSSAGSSSAVAARLCPFALGSETLGSIVSPTRTCATSGLRPTFGRVSRAGCMTLAWTMDKIGPIANRIEDCAIVFDALLGADGKDPTVVEKPYVRDTKLEWSKVRVGVGRRLRPAEERIRDWFKEKGAEIVSVEFPNASLVPMLEALSAESASVHDKLFRTAKDDSELGKWGPTYREAQFIRAVDYLHGVRMRVDLIQKTEAELSKVDFMIGDGDLARMNLTGHPSLVIAFDKESERTRPATVVLTGRMFSESSLIAAGVAIQNELPPLAISPPASP